MRKPLITLCTLVALAGCGGGDSDGAAAPSADVSPSAEAPAPTEAARSDRCLDVDPAKLAAIAGGAEDGVGTITFTEGAAVKSQDYSEVYMIAGRFDAPGVDGEVGVWASNALGPGEGLIMSVDGFAQQFTVWPDADQTSAQIRLGDDGTEEAKDCLE